MNEEMKQEPIAPTEAEIVSSPVFDAKDIEENKYVAALSYIGILFLVPLLAKKESPFAQFHAKQGLVLTIIYVIGGLVFWIPIIGWGLALAVFVANVMALFRTLGGGAWEMPIIKDVVKKLNI